MKTVTRLLHILRLAGYPFGYGLTGALVGGALNRIMVAELGFSIAFVGLLFAMLKGRGSARGPAPSFAQRKNRKEQRRRNRAMQGAGAPPALPSTLFIPLHSALQPGQVAVQFFAELFKDGIGSLGGAAVASFHGAL